MTKILPISKLFEGKTKGKRADCPLPVFRRFFYPYNVLCKVNFKFFRALGERYLLKSIAYLFRGGGRHDKLVVLLYLTSQSERVGGAIKGKSIMHWQKLLVL